MTRFAILFLVVLFGMFTVELTSWGQQWLVNPFTERIAAISAALVQWFDDGVLAQGRVIKDAASGFAVSIEPGCNGVEASIVLFAAMLAFPAPWRWKVLGMVVGFVTIQAMNLLRIISLFYLGQWNSTAFEWAHLYVWQALIILDVLVVFLIWLRLMSRHGGGHGEATA